MAGEITPSGSAGMDQSQIPEVKKISAGSQAGKVSELVHEEKNDTVEIGVSGGGNPVQRVTKESPSLKDLLPENLFVIPASKVEEIKEKLGMTTEELLQALVPVAREKARPPISNYLVGAAGLGKSGNIYLGVNLEFPGFPLNQTVHGEQFVTANALNNGETGLTAIAVSAAPCGHCRQFLNELATNKELMVLVPKEPPTPLTELLPKSFGPQDLGVESALLAPHENKVGLKPVPRAIVPAHEGVLGMAEMAFARAYPESLSRDDEALMIREALEAAKRSYAPYSQEPSGVAIQTKDGKVYSGSYIENAAYNPSLSPLQGALVALVTDGKNYGEISKVLLLEKERPKVSQEEITRELVRRLSPAASFEVMHLA